MAPFLGIDMNGIRDVSVDSVTGPVLRGGEVPSVVIVQPRQFGAPLRVIAGAEAALAIEGRGWHWPPSARVDDVRSALRVPMGVVLDSISQDRPVEVAGEQLPPIDLLASAIEALARPRGPIDTSEDRLAIIAVPDDGRFLEDARQRLIDAARQARVTPTLLWRPVAALLGLEPQLTSDVVTRLSGRTIGVLCCLGDGVHASRLTIEVKSDNRGPYIVPVRKTPGVFVPYRTSVRELAGKVALRSAPADDPQNGWQLLWGDGLAFRWILRLPSTDAIVQTTAGWRMVSGTAPSDLPAIDFSEAALDAVNSLLQGVDYRVYEGPALEVFCHGQRLAYFLRSHDPAHTPTLYITNNEPHLAARGCVVYQQRRIAQPRRCTYFDHLPQLRLAVRRGAEPDFVDLIDPDARVEGGETYSDTCDLGLSVLPGTAALNFYLLRESHIKPRHVREELSARIARAVPVQLRISQQPAQGTARLTLLAVEADESFRPIELSWERMTEEDLTQEEVLERLREAPADVPPVHPQPCHALLWTATHAGAGGSLENLVPKLALRVHQRPVDRDSLLKLLRAHSLLLTRRSSPAILTQNRLKDRSLYRAISSDGTTPETDGEMPSALIDQFDECLRWLDRVIVAPTPPPRALFNAIVRLSGWCFLRCPSGIRQHMFEVAKQGGVPNAMVYFRAMGKVFESGEECRAFFGLLERQLKRGEGDVKMYQVEGLFYLLSLRENAPFALEPKQATFFAYKLLDRIDERLGGRRALSRLVNVCLKTYAGLMRYRLVRPDFMTGQDAELGERQAEIFDRLKQRAQREHNLAIVQLTESVFEWSEKRGTDRTILQWDEGADDGGDEE